MILLAFTTALASGGSSVHPFSCDTAATHLGFPAGKVVRCAPFPNLAALYAVRIEDASLEHPKAFVVAVVDGQVVRERGTAAALRFLQGAGAGTLELGEVKALFNALEAWPAGFGPAEQAPAGTGYEPSVRAEPFRLQVFARAPVPSPGLVAVPPMRRATLEAGADGRFAWTVEAQGAGGWQLVSALPVE
jgi:hypothetical protein